MIRWFQTHEIRKVRELEGLWDFAPVQNKEGNPTQYNYKLHVPGCWEMHPELGTYRGQGVYRTFWNQEKQTHIRLEFKGISHTANIYVDGKQVASHYNAYTAFDVVLPDVKPGEHELVVRVDNGFGEHSALHIPNDYYTYGGIIRPVILEEISDIYIERVWFTPYWEKESWQARWKAFIRQAVPSSEPLSRSELRIQLGGVEVNLQGGTRQGDVWIMEGEGCYPQAESWSLTNPRLYTFKAELLVDGKVCDDWFDRVGFRRVAVNREGLLLNGEKLQLKGVNRHEDHPEFGAALPPGLMAKDLELIRDLGCNTVRTSHYPNDERFLDLCDEFGLAVWEENHARGLEIEHMRNPNFAWQSEQVTREMVEQHYNHPSILIWAILNECASHKEEGREHYRRQLQIIRDLDNSRPLSFATHHRADDICLDLADIVSFNLYPGWYTDEQPAELAKLARLWADEKGGRDKPLIISEFGADGYYGFRSHNREKGSEERQADILAENLKAYLAMESVTGMFIWQFCDCRVTEATGWLMSRGQTKNSKGIVDGYRRPKLAYDTVRHYFKESL